MKYAEKLKDPRWQRVRLETLQAASWRCQLCNRGDLTLHVHHVRYRQGLEPWQYPADDLIVLCEVCHGEQHGIQPELAASRDVVQPPRHPEMSALLEELAGCPTDDVQQISSIQRRVVALRDQLIGK